MIYVSAYVYRWPSVDEREICRPLSQLRSEREKGGERVEWNDTAPMRSTPICRTLFFNQLDLAKIHRNRDEFSLDRKELEDF